MDPKANAKLQSMMDRETVKIRRVNNGYVINSEKGMQIASTLEDVIAFLGEKFAKTITVK